VTGAGRISHFAVSEIIEKSICRGRIIINPGWAASLYLFPLGSLSMANFTVSSVPVFL
jgi:hypothetical protein